MSEKYDGIRAYWNGKEFLSRQGRMIRVPSFFMRGMPRGESLDGELWMGRNSYEQLTSLVNTRRLDSEGMNDQWKEVRYMIFDLPNSGEAVEERIRALKAMDLPDHAEVVVKIACEEDQHLERHLSTVVEKGGEGIMAQRPGSKYQIGRTNDIVKVKVR